MKTSLHSWMPVVSGSDPPLQEKPVRGAFSCPSQSWPGWREQNKRWIYSRNKYVWLPAQEQHTTRKPVISESVILKLGKFGLHVQLCAALHDLNIESFLLTFLYMYRSRKSKKKLFPFRKAPATDTTTTSFSRTSGVNRIRLSASVSRSKEWSCLLTVTIWTGPGSPLILCPISNAYYGWQ